jgi:thioredoxin-related protein
MKINNMTKIFLIIIIISSLLITGCNNQNDDGKQSMEITNNSNINSNEKEFVNTKSHTCPYGIEQEKYPRCGLYEDKDNNGFCDLSE